MSVYLQDPDVTLYHGDVLDVLKGMPDESVDCAATSPPFYGLRDYGVEGQIGLESTPEEWRDRLVEVFREVRRVLVPTGTLWVECGDSYAHGGAAGGSVFDNGRTDGRTSYESDKARGRQARVSLLSGGLKPKDLIGSPFLLAFGLRDDGWWWRSTSIWHKPNCLPESVTDRPVVSHSYVFQFSKKARYYCDMEAVREPWAPAGPTNPRARYGGIMPSERRGQESSQPTGEGSYTLGNRRSLYDVSPQVETLDGSEGEAPRGPDGRRKTHVEKGENSLQHRDGERWPNDGRSLRSVWTIPTEGFPEAHFATWPTKLAERILLMACPEGGCVLDPFVGSGTTCHVARKLGRRSVGIDLSVEYLALAAKRLAQQSLLAVEA